MYWQGNAVMYDQLHDARHAAMQYVRRIAPLFSGEERESLQQAATLYEQMVGLMTEEWACFPFIQAVYQHPNGWLLRPQQQDFLGRRVPALSDTWSPEARSRGIQVLRQVKELDKQALEALQAAVDS